MMSGRFVAFHFARARSSARQIDPRRWAARLTFRSLPMIDKSLVEHLYDAHLNDLKSATDIVPDVGDEFICPICLVGFTSDNITNGNLTDGHVWPAFIRAKSGSEVAKTHHVLLCRACNSDAGKHGDAHIQLLEKVRDAVEQGRHYGYRLVQVVRGPAEEPINLRAYVSIRDQLTVTLTFDIDKKSGYWARNNPKEQARFRSLGDRGESVSMILHPHHGVKPHLAKAGWVTSAYLYAFYTLGYRYIFHESLNIVREYIVRSFEDAAKEQLELPESEVFRFEMNTNAYENPQIGLVIPLLGDRPVYLQVNFLDYQVRLPCRFNAVILKGLIDARISDSEELISRALATGNPLYAPIACNKLDQHDCIWDYVLGKPLSDEHQESRA